MGVPGLVWEGGIRDELAAGGELTFIGLGTEDAQSDDVIGWFVAIAYPDGSKKLFVKQSRYEPRVFKTFAGVRGLVRQFQPDVSTVSLPIVPQVRSVREVWALMGDASPDSKS